MNIHYLTGKPVLVTGGAGFIGCNLVKGLTEIGAEVYVADNESRGSKSNLEDVGFEIKSGINYFKVDLRDEQICGELVKGMHTIYHLAADVGGIAYVLKDGLKVWKNNTLIDANMFQSVTSESSVENLIYASSSCVYPLNLSSSKCALQERDAWKGETHTMYGAQKLLGEKAIKMHATKKGVRSIPVRFHNVYGPRSIMKGNGAQVIQALISKALNNPEQDLEVWGSGKQGRDFIYVDDIVDWLVNIFSTKDGKIPEQPIQRGSGINTSVGEIARIILETLNSSAKIYYKPVPDEGEEGRISDNSIIEELYPQLPPPVSITEGIKRYIDWALERETWWKVEAQNQVSMQLVNSINSHVITNPPEAVLQQTAQVLAFQKEGQQSMPSKRLGSYLLEANLITQEQLEIALKEQQKSNTRLGEIISNQGWLSQTTIEYMMDKVVLPERKLSLAS